MTWTNAYIGIPFQSCGRTRSGLDCWGLVALVMLERFDISVKDFLGRYSSVDERDVIQRLFNTESANWQQVTEPQEGDLVVLKFANRPCHFGVVATDRFFLHCYAGIDSALESLDSYRWKSRIHAFYRRRP